MKKYSFPINTASSINVRKKCLINVCAHIKLSVTRRLWLVMVLYIINVAVSSSIVPIFIHATFKCTINWKITCVCRKQCRCYFA